MADEGQKAQASESAAEAPAEEGGAPKGAERRSEPRVSVDLWIRQEHGNDISYTHSGNLSTGGVLFDHGFPHAIGTEVELHFNLPGEPHEFHVAAEVVGAGVRDERPLTSLRFLRMTFDEYVLLTRFVRAQLDSDVGQTGAPDRSSKKRS